MSGDGEMSEQSSLLSFYLVVMLGIFHRRVMEIEVGDCADDGSASCFTKWL